MKLIAAIAVVMLTGGMGTAFAQQKPAAKGGAAAADGENTQYKAKTVYDFEDDTVEGDLQRPDGELVDSMRKVKHSSLIEIRKDFIPEMLKSLEDI
ncbi:MAG TPA: adventurous gliding motility protein CglF [Polyangia bacterium]|jgi:hypothetical protein|nr:adventurous gliding motility protein CglF [Polyangia bacterium]